jgi:hypothetical protein
MSVEHQPKPTESNERATAELEAARAEKYKELRQNLETSAEDDPDRRAEAARKARDVINKKPETAPEPEPAPAAEKPKGTITIPFINHQLNYAQTLASIQRKLSPASRTFSKVIHTPAVEKTSEALEKTVARPSVTLGASWTALIVGGIFYLTARTYGYQLSGSELLFSFIVGAVLGLVLEGLWRLIKRRPR